MSLTMLKIITDQNAILNCLQKHSPIVDKTYVSPVIQLHSDVVAVECFETFLHGFINKNKFDELCINSMNYSVFIFCILNIYLVCLSQKIKNICFIQCFITYMPNNSQ